MLPTRSRLSLDRVPSSPCGMPVSVGRAFKRTSCLAASSQRHPHHLFSTTSLLTESPHGRWQKLGRNGSFWKARRQARALNFLPSHASLPYQVQSSTHPTHLVVLANGLFGSSHNWLTIKEEFAAHEGLDQVLVHASEANALLTTFTGIDECGQRLADEISQVVMQHPTLTHISVIGHSMGGLLLRYAVGVLYDPGSRRVAGLVPSHYISMATPHCGCASSDNVESQVPFIAWASAIPPLGAMLRALAVPVSSTFLQRTGSQFFLADGKQEGEGRNTAPLLMRMTEDDHSRQQYFFSALQSFMTRTAYGNVADDHLVGWANSTLRFMHQLPSLPLHTSQTVGVIRSDPITAALSTQQTLDPDSNKPILPAPNAPTSRYDIPIEQRAREWLVVSSMDSYDEGSGSESTTAGPRPEVVSVMLQRLQALPWRRIDVTFGGAALNLLAHNHIQVTRKTLNSEGRGVAKHLVEQFASLDSLVKEQSKREVGKL